MSPFRMKVASANRRDLGRARTFRNPRRRESPSLRDRILRRKPGRTLAPLDPALFRGLDSPASAASPAGASTAAAACPRPGGSDGRRGRAGGGAAERRGHDRFEELARRCQQLPPGGLLRAVAGPGDVEEIIRNADPDQQKAHEKKQRRVSAAPDSPVGEVEKQERRPEKGQGIEFEPGKASGATRDLLRHWPERTRADPSRSLSRADAATRSSESRSLASFFAEASEDKSLGMTGKGEGLGMTRKGEGLGMARKGEGLGMARKGEGLGMTKRARARDDRKCLETLGDRQSNVRHERGEADARAGAQEKGAEA